MVRWCIGFMWFGARLYVGTGVCDHSFVVTSSGRMSMTQSIEVWDSMYISCSISQNYRGVRNQYC